MIEQTYQEDDRHIKQECAKSVQEECEETNVVNLSNGDLGDFPSKRNNTVHDSADRGKVVKRDKGVHLVLSRAEQGLDQV